MHAMSRRRLARGRAALALAPGGIGALAAAAGGAAVRVGLDAGFSLAGRAPAQAIELGARAAIAETKRSGGVLRGRPFELTARANRGNLAHERQVPLQPPWAGAAGVISHGLQPNCAFAWLRMTRSPCPP